jgi:tRNA (guanine37-N1)-methyltransferase
MVLKPEPFFEAVETLCAKEGLLPSAPVILTSPQGRPFDQQAATELALEEQIVILCGRYRGVDERVREALVTHEFSVGDLILNGGEAAALVMVEAITRLLPGAMGDPTSGDADSFVSGLLDHPHYTRPAEYRDMEVPEILLSGNHAAIDDWRRRQSLKRTFERRPDLLENAPLTDEDAEYLDQLRSGDDPAD